MEEEELNWPNLQSALYDFIVDLTTTYKERLKADGKTASGNLVNSIKPLDITFTSRQIQGKISLADYWKYVEFGRKPGKFPPPDKILNWIKIKPVIPRPVNGITPSEKTLAYLIGRKIAREGIKPGNQFSETIDVVYDRHRQTIEDAISKDLDDTLTVILRIS